MTMDEDKENQTPRGLQWESNVDLAPHCNRNQEREEQELQQALTQSLMERVRLKSLFAVFNGALGNFHGFSVNHQMWKMYLFFTTSSKFKNKYFTSVALCHGEVSILVH